MSTWHSHVFTPLPREGACTFTVSSAAPLDLASREPKGRFVVSLLVEQRQGNRSKGCHLEGGGPRWRPAPGAHRAAAQSPGLVEFLLSALHVALDSPLGAALLSYPPRLPPGRRWKRCPSQWQTDFLACVLPIEKVEAEGRLRSQVITLF